MNTSKSLNELVDWILTAPSYTKYELGQAIVEAVEGLMPEKLKFEPKKNMSCSFSCMVKKPSELNPCPDCGGTRIYEWDKFVNEHGFPPDEIKGYNKCVDIGLQAIKEWQ